MSKSSVLNLYDAVNGSNHFQVKAYTDKVDFASTTLPLNLKATLVNLQNADGQSVSDVAGTILKTIADLAKEVTDRETAITDEAKERIRIDDGLQTAIDKEIEDRKDAITEEASQRTAAIKAERNARTEFDATLRSDIDQEIQDRGTAVSAEAKERIRIDDGLQAAIDKEVTDRTNAVSDEETERKRIDGILQTNIDNEATARGGADETLSGLITAEKNARLAEVAVERSRIDAILQGTSIDLNQLQELITAYTTSDNNILAQIGSINTNITAIQAQLNGTDQKLNALIEDVAVVGAPVPPSPDYVITGFVMDPNDAEHVYLQFQKNGVDLTAQEAIALTGTVATFDGFAGEITLMGHTEGESGEALVKMSSSHQPIEAGPPSFPIDVFVVKQASYIMSARSKLGEYNRITLTTFDGVVVLNDAVGSSFTIGSDSTVYQVTQNNVSFKLLTDVYVGDDKPIPSYIYLV